MELNKQTNQGENKMSVKVTLTNLAGSKTLISSRSMESAITWYANATTPQGSDYSYRTTTRTAEYAMLVRNIPGSVHTLEFELLA